MIGLYSPGHSLVHRAPMLLKLVLLSLAVLGVGLLGELWQLSLCLFAVAALFLVARIPLGAAWKQIGPILWILVIAVPLQALFAGWATAGLMAGRLLIAVALAALFTLTTTVTAVLEGSQKLLRPLRRWVDADRVGLLLALSDRGVEPPPPPKPRSRLARLTGRVTRLETPQAGRAPVPNAPGGPR